MRQDSLDKNGNRTASRAALSLLLAASLVLTGVPLALAVEAPSARAQDMSTRAEDAESQSESPSRHLGPGDSPNMVLQGSQHVETVQLPANSEAETTSGEAAPQVPGRVSGNVALGKDDPKASIGEIRVDGLVYTINADGITAALADWYGTAPTGDVSVPARVVSGSDSYTVTSLINGGGGGIS